MQKGWLVLFLFFSTLLQAQDIDVQHYKFKLDLSDSSSIIKGEATIRFKALHSLTSVKLDLATVTEGKGMHVTGIYQGEKDNNRLPFSAAKDQLLITLNDSLKKEEEAQITIFYWGIPADGMIISKNKFGDRTFFADNWPRRAHQWIPCVDRPDDKASFEFVVTAPSHYRVVSNGVKMQEKELGNEKRFTHWKEDTPLSTKIMVIGVARFAVKTFADSPAGLPVSAWVYPQDSAKGFFDFALTPEIVKFFSGYIAPFPYKKLANVQSTTIMLGMENASCIFYAENAITGERSMEETLVHEIAHQWFGDMASEKSFAHLWLSEGFADYLTYLFIEKKYGREAATERLQKAREEVIDFARYSSRPVVDSTTNLMSLLNANSYQKGSWVLHMLRNEVGDSLFHQIIQTYYSQYKGGNAETRDFEAVAEKVLGKELKWFFDQWLYHPGLPQLLLKKTITNEGTRLTIVQTQKDLFRFTLPVSVETSPAKATLLQIPVTERVTSVLLAKGKLIRLTVDPDCTLLFAEAK
jgi:aminopeptidase N